MKPRLRSPALLLAALLLVGCARGDLSYARGPGSRLEQMPDLSEPETPTPEPQPGTLWTDGLTAAQQKYGSAGLLAWPCVLYSVYLQQPDGPGWSEEEIARSQRNLEVAVDWITQQAAAYGVQAQLSYDDGSDNSPLSYTYSLRSRLRGGVDSEESNDFLDEMDMLCATLDTVDLHNQYGTDHIGFLLFLPVDGTSFTMAHYAEDGVNFTYEYCCLYRYDAYAAQAEPESPATFAHEILHLFGAPDLYAGSSDPYVDGELTAYVEQTYPDDIMLSTYAEDGSNVYTSIDKVISPLTAYCIGLADSCPELALFPQLADVEPGIFRYGGGTSDYWPDSGVVAV